MSQCLPSHLLLWLIVILKSLGSFDTISLGDRKSNSVFHLLSSNFKSIVRNGLSVSFQKAKQKTAVLSVASFLEQMLAEDAEQEEISRILVGFVSQKWIMNKTTQLIMNKTTQLRDGEVWYVKDIADAMAAIIAITSKHPKKITFIMQDEGKSTLNPSMLCSILANATKRTTVSLNCLDSFFKGGEESQEWKELLSVCLNNEK